MKSLSFRTYLFYLMALTMTLPLLMLSFAQFRMIEQEISQENIVLIEDAGALANNIKGRVEAAKGLVKMAANMYQLVPDQDKHTLNQILIGLRDALPYFLNVHFDNAEGVTIAFDPPRTSKGESNIGVDHKDRHHWLQMKERDSVFVSDVIQAKGAATGPIVNVTAPSITPDGKIIGYAVSALELKNLYDQVVAGLGLKQTVVWILDSKGIPIYANDRTDFNKAIFSPSEMRHFILSANAPREVMQLESSNLVGVIEPIKEYGWVVGVFKRAEDRENAIYSMIATNTLIFLFLLLFSFMMARYACKPLTDNVSKLIAQVRQGKAIPTEEEKVHAPVELVELQKTFCRLLGKVQSHQNELQKLKDEPGGSIGRELKLMTEQVDFLKAVINYSPQIIVISDMNGYVRFTNANGIELFGQENVGLMFGEILKERFSSDVPPHLWLSQSEIVFTEKETGVMYRMKRAALAVGKISRQIYELSPLQENEPR